MAGRMDLLSIRNPAVKELLRLRTGRRRAREKRSLVLVRGQQMIRTIGEYFRFKEVFTTEGPDAFGQYNAERVVRADKAVLKHVLFAQNFEAQRHSVRLEKRGEDELVVGTIEQPLASSFGLGQASKDDASEGVDGPPLRQLLAIDGVKHPDNMGMLLSTAVALRYDGVFLSGSCIDPFNHKVLEASQAVHWTLPYRHGSVAELLHVCARHRLAPCAAQSATAAAGEPGGAQGAAAPVLVADLPELDRGRFAGFCLAVGNETRGVSPELLARSRRVALPMSELVESLNAGVAGGVLMHALSCAWAQPA